MTFNSWLFPLFFLVFYPVYLIVKPTRFASLWLVMASYVFYGWFNPLYVLLIAYATVVDFLVAARIEKAKSEIQNPKSEMRKKLWLLVSIINNIGLLSFFKYGAFAAENLNFLLAHLGLAWKVPPPGILFPVGISFFTFRSLTYTIDCYRGLVERERSLLRYAAFVSLFPMLVCGPVERACNLLPQMRQNPKITGQDIADGLSLFIVGLFKKLALADYLGLYVDKVYAQPAAFDAPALALATFAFAWQIYFDFSGYTDMARGIARLMGFRLMLNFNNPYLATGLGDFWRRWHISLSSWFRDYVYIPLGGNRKGTLRTYVNLFVTMVIAGVWHGAAWTFVIWGVVHAVGNIMTREFERSTFYKEKVPTFAKQMLVFVLVTFAWAFFRARSVGDAWLIVKRIFVSGWANPLCPLLILALILSVWAYQFIYESRARRLLEPAPVRICLVVAMALYMVVFASSSTQPFIYEQF
jgi:D-alanyl-lipoteichoic acid acyltransferase DltB (MBOAT superfamily)